MAASPPTLATRHPLPSAMLYGPAQLETPATSSLGLTRLVASWHLLSLDAPTVATLWTVFIALCAGIRLPWTDVAAMFTAVWILYAADRLLDSRERTSSSGPAELEARHRFHKRHRGRFLVVICFACSILLPLLTHSNPESLRLYGVLGTLLAVWLLLVHARPNPRSRLPKELAVGLFFPAAIFIPTVARLPSFRAALLPDALLFAGVCSLNCLHIFLWEHPFRHRAHWTTRWCICHLRLLSLGTILACVALAARFFVSADRLLALPALACAVSAALLRVLHTRRHSTDALTLRAAADVCLLTPALLLPVLLLHLCRTV